VARGQNGRPESGHLYGLVVGRSPSGPPFPGALSGDVPHRVISRFRNPSTRGQNGRPESGHLYGLAVETNGSGPPFPGALSAPLTHRVIRIPGRAPAQDQDGRPGARHLYGLQAARSPRLEPFPEDPPAAPGGSVLAENRAGRKNRPGSGSNHDPTPPPPQGLAGREGVQGGGALSKLPPQTPILERVGFFFEVSERKVKSRIRLWGIGL